MAGSNESIVGSAFRKGLATRAERVAAGQAGGGAGALGSALEMMTVAGTATGTVLWNRSKPNAGTWIFGEIMMSLMVGSSLGGAKGAGALQRVSSGVLTGAFMNLILGSGTKSAGDVVKGFHLAGDIKNL